LKKRKEGLAMKLDGSLLLFIISILTMLFPLLKLAAFAWLIGGTIQLVWLIKRHPRYWTTITITVSTFAFFKVLSFLFPGASFGIGKEVWIIALVLIILFGLVRLGLKFGRSLLATNSHNGLEGIPDSTAATVPVSTTASTVGCDDFSDFEDFDGVCECFV
jgi:hypothetical protein